MILKNTHINYYTEAYAIVAIIKSLTRQNRQKYIYIIQINNDGIFNKHEDKPCQSDSFARHVEEQIVAIAFGSVWAPLYKHDRRGQQQQLTDLIDER